MFTSVLAPLRPAARIFTGSTYVLLGFDALRAPGARVEQAGPVLAAVRKAVPLPEDDELVVRANAAVQVCWPRSARRFRCLRTTNWWCGRTPPCRSCAARC